MNILKIGMNILGMEWQNSTQGHWESASTEGKHGEKTASTDDERSQVSKWISVNHESESPAVMLGSMSKWILLGNT